MPPYFTIATRISRSWARCSTTYRSPTSAASSMPTPASAAARSNWNGTAAAGLLADPVRRLRGGLLHLAAAQQRWPPVDYNGAPESFPKWSYGGDLSYARIIGAYQAHRGIELQFPRYLQPILPARQQRFHHSEVLAGEREPVARAGLRRALDRDAVGSKIFNRSYDITRNFFLPTSEVARPASPQRSAFD